MDYPPLAFLPCRYSRNKDSGSRNSGNQRSGKRILFGHEQVRETVWKGTGIIISYFWHLMAGAGVGNTFSCHVYKSATFCMVAPSWGRRWEQPHAPAFTRGWGWLCLCFSLACKLTRGPLRCMAFAPASWKPYRTLGTGGPWQPGEWPLGYRPLVALSLFLTDLSACSPFPPVPATPAQGILWGVLQAPFHYCMPFRSPWGPHIEMETGSQKALSSMGRVRVYLMHYSKWVVYSFLGLSQNSTQIA